MSPNREQHWLPAASFTMVMGTGAFAVSTFAMSRKYESLTAAAWALNYFNYLLFIFLLLMALITWPRNVRNMRSEFDFPHSAAFYAAVGISLLVLASQALEFNMGKSLAVSLWAAGAFLTFGFNFAIFFRFFLHRGLSLAHFTPVFFIPVGGLAVIPVGGTKIIGLTTGAWQDVVFMVNTVAVGAGILLYFGLFSLMLQRHLLYSPFPHKIAPATWIHMAPIGWGGVGLIGLGQAGWGYEAQEIARFFASLMWGGGCWWFVMVALLAARSALKGKLAFSLTFWGFIFPMDAMTVLAGRLGAHFDFAFQAAWAVTCLLWLLCVFKTAMLIFHSFGGRSKS